LVWPGIAVAAMFVLGWAISRKPTAVDTWFQRFRYTPVHWLLFFTDPWLLAVTLIVCIAVALRVRRRRLAVAIAVSPLVGIALAQLLKHLIGRTRGDDLAYPSGHTTAVVIVMGLFVLVANAAVWAVILAAAVTLLGMIGQGVTYHYFTDTVGALLLGSAVVCVVALAVELDTRQPECDADHTGG
jgi:membrane-associated phospholipid phosphatase